MQGQATRAAIWIVAHGADLVHGDACGVGDALPQLVDCKGLLHRGNVVLDGFVYEVNLREDAYTT